MKIKISPDHWRKPLECYHGPTAWPWWKMFAVHYVNLSVRPPSAGHRFWFYTRGEILVGEPRSYFAGEHSNRGRCIDIFFDRRK